MARKAAGSDVQEALQRLGAGRVEATLVAALASGTAMATKDVVDRTGLRQPEVSVGMQVLRDRGWVEAEPMPRAGKGRPMHRYRLQASAADVRKHYEAAGQATIKEMEAAVAVLRKRLV